MQNQTELKRWKIVRSRDIFFTNQLNWESKDTTIVSERGLSIGRGEKVTMCVLSKEQID